MVEIEIETAAKFAKIFEGAYPREYDVVYRGGSYNDEAKDVIAPERGGRNAPDGRWWNVGFRLARSQ